ncbi:hypothetical protein L7F22_038120 [Adiantum nelumboides]|nr:hypothetical protein [Adiantum nelumboides]
MAGPASTKWMCLTLLGVLLQAVGLCFFVMGFFPVKPALKGNSGIESLNFDCSLEHDVGLEGTSYSFLEKLEVKPQFDRVVLMVIDGLPAEFLLGRDGRPPSAEIAAAMPFTQGLISSRRAMGFHARAAPPTVTMPRLKAMTSGAIAGFLDVAFNFNTQALLDDNLIGQLERRGWNMTLYGDDTWLRLFPKSFARKDGVSSFFAKDTIQVDQNVSRHLHEELAKKDWDLLILHYLGLDHVGHLGGRSSSLMADKLQEMDEVIKQLHASLLEDGTNVLDRETLLVSKEVGSLADSFPGTHCHGGMLLSLQLDYRGPSTMKQQVLNRFFDGYRHYVFAINISPNSLELAQVIPFWRSRWLELKLIDKTSPQLGSKLWHPEEGTEVMKGQRQREQQYQNEETDLDLGHRDTEAALSDASARSSRRRAVERAQRRA